MSDVILIRQMLARMEEEKALHPDKPLELCGVIVEREHGNELVECANVSTEPDQQFRIGAVEWARLHNSEKVVAVWHTHPRATAQPTQADLVQLEPSGLPWHIVGADGSHSLTLPTGYVAPYVGREFYHGILDCYALCRDWYSREMGIELPDVERADDWWSNGGNMYVEQFTQHGFREVSPEVNFNDLKRGDGLLMQMASRVPNHGAIYLGDGTILHHRHGRLSEIVPYTFGSDWFKRTTHHLRHESQL
jgi:cell wall-associated NlpC family hydrolase